MNVVTAAITGDEKSDIASATAVCADGDVAIGGGVSAETVGWVVRASNPNSTDKNPTGWFGEITGDNEDENHGGDGVDSSSVDKSTDDSSTDDNKDENQNDDEQQDDGPGTGTVYAVCMTA